MHEWCMACCSLTALLQAGDGQRGCKVVDLQALLDSGSDSLPSDALDVLNRVQKRRKKAEKQIALSEGAFCQ